MIHFTKTCLYFHNTTEYYIISIVSVKQIKNSPGILKYYVTFHVLVLMKRSGKRNIENNKVFLNFLAPNCKLSWM